MEKARKAEKKNSDFLDLIICLNLSLNKGLNLYQLRKLFPLLFLVQYGK